jgi:hypothetical protein
VPLQSLHEFWLAKVHFNKPGQPVERVKKSELEGFSKKLIFASGCSAAG